MTSRHPKTLIVGAGIVGASIACHLARRHAPVVVIDSGEVAGGATARSFAWINSWSSANEAYARLRHHSVQDYHRLQTALNGALPLTWSGALIWKQAEADTRQRIREQTAAGYDVRLLDSRDIAELEPGLRAPPTLAAFAAGEGAIEPVEATKVLLRAAQNAGADIRRGANVDRLHLENGCVTGVETDGGTIVADQVVIAAGTGSGALTASAGITMPLDHSPALLVRFRSEARLISSVIINPDFEIRQPTDHVLLAATAFEDAEGENGPDAVAHRLLSTLKDRLKGADGLQLESVEVGLRPIPTDGLPIVGFAPQAKGLYLAVMHSGITLAPAVGRFAAAELLDGDAVRLLDICRPLRFH